jgi:hypothetical protein
MPEIAVVALIIAFPVVGLLAGRWIALALPLVGWPLYFLGLTKGWWGYGVGDGWQYGAVLLTAIGVLTTAVAVALARFVQARAATHAGHSRRSHMVL